MRKFIDILNEGMSSIPNTVLFGPEPTPVMENETVEDAAYLIEEIVGHLGAAEMQILPTDDAIISEHLSEAFELSKRLRRLIAG